LGRGDRIFSGAVRYLQIHRFHPQYRAIASILPALVSDFAEIDPDLDPGRDDIPSATPGKPADVVFIFFYIFSQFFLTKIGKKLEMRRLKIVNF